MDSKSDSRSHSELKLCIQFCHATLTVHQFLSKSKGDEEFLVRFGMEWPMLYGSEYTALIFRFFASFFFSFSGVVYQCYRIAFDRLSNSKKKRENEAKKRKISAA